MQMFFLKGEFGKNALVVEGEGALVSRAVLLSLQGVSSPQRRSAPDRTLG